MNKKYRKQKHGIFKLINDNIKCKWTKFPHLKHKDCQTGQKNKCQLFAIYKKMF